jgi:WD40 repeat protein
VAFDSHGARVAAWGQDGTIKLWDANTRGLTEEVAHPGNVTTGAWSPDDTLLASGHGDGTVTISGIHPGDEIVTLRGHVAAIHDLAWSPDSARLASVSYDFTARIWGIASKSMVLGPFQHSHEITSVAWEPDGQRLATGSIDETIKIWEAATGRETLTLRGYVGTVTSLSWGPDGSLASGGVDGSMRICSSIRAQESSVLPGHGGRLASVSWSPDGKWLASSGDEGKVRIWDAATRQEVLSLDGHDESRITQGDGLIRRLAWSPDGKHLASAGLDGKALVWEVPSGRIVFALPADHGAVWSVKWSPDGAHLAGDASYGRGVLKSTNGWATWTLLGNSVFDRLAIKKIIVQPNNPNVVYVTTNNLSINGLIGSGAGVWKTTNGGMSWTNTTTAISTSEAYSDVAFDPADRTYHTLYAAVASFGGNPLNGLYKTTNGGSTWSRVGAGLPRGDVDGWMVIAIGTSGLFPPTVVPSVLYVAIAGTGQPGSSQLGTLFKLEVSIDQGATWRDVSLSNYMSNQGDFDSTLAVDPLNPFYVYAGGSPTVLETLSAGASWYNISTGPDGNGPHADHHGAAFDAAGRYLDVNDGGIWRLEGFQFPFHTWTDLNTNNLQVTQFTGQDTGLISYFGVRRLDAAFPGGT